MPWVPITLRPGVDTVKTQSLNEAGVSQAQLIRYRDGLIESYGGWVNFINTTINSTVRDLHPWQDIAGVKRLSAAATANLVAMSGGMTQDITPQTTTTNFTPNVSITSGSNQAQIIDNSGSANVSIYNTVYFNTPVAIGAFLLNGAYPIISVSASNNFNIQLPSNSTSTVTSSGILPIFNISSGSQTITTTLPNNNFPSITGLYQQFIAPTQVGSSSAGVLVSGKYQITAVLNSTQFTMNALVQASTTASATMNSSQIQLVYYVTLAPATVGSGFGIGAFGSGGAFGTGSGFASNPGTPITATDWTQDNWGEILLACPMNGPVYAWSADSGFQNAQVVSQAPFFNGGIFVAMPQQILVAWKSVQTSGVQDPLIVRWSNQGDYTNWTVSNQTTAGSFHIPTGSQIVGGIQCPQFAMISTDLDVWAMNYVGGVVVFNFTRIGSGCGWIGSHACGIYSGNPFWMGTNNFYTLGAGGVVPMPCTVWTQIFQNLNIANQSKVRCAVNSAFSEVMWFFPSLNATENDSYVKVRMVGQEYEWDYGSLSRTAWADVSILGMPLGVDTSGQIYQHEIGTSITGAGLPSFMTGWFALSEGEDIPFVDIIIPDFIWGLRSGAQTASINITFFGVNYPGDTPIQYGPYTVTQGTEFINVRIRNRLLSAFIQSNVNSEFWRLGKIRFRIAQSGRR